MRTRAHSLAGPRGRRGVAALELALILPVLVPLLLGVADFSMAYHRQLQLSATLAAGAEYAFSKGQNEVGTSLDNDVTTFVNAVTPVTLKALSVTYNNGDSSTTNCYCVDGATPAYTGPVTCGAACSDGSGSTAGKYLAISGTVSYSPLFSVDSVIFPTSFTQNVMVRLQ